MTSPRVRQCFYMSCPRQQWPNVGTMAAPWCLFICWTRPEVAHIPPSETVNSRGCKGHSRPTEAGQPRLLMAGNRTVEKPQMAPLQYTKAPTGLASQFLLFFKKKKTGKKFSRGPFPHPPLLPLLCLWCHLIINNLLLKCLWYVNDMLILPINLSFTSRGLLRAAQRHQQREGSVGERRIHISRSSSLSCVPSYIWIWKKERDRQVLL